ncbi:RsmB/NOP family class I SAM-dependent RNA methyltransferase [Oleiharenicola lentus]|uniref:RsmB/NOP family class I SAM-dependent RNA methyltransferase n=1 Tax=Oleiharenicola lentus TaxID=2508720 RepID=UPI003F67BBD7
MNPNIAANQQRLFLDFLAELRPHLRRDSGLPRRLKEIFSRNRSLGSRDRKLYRELVFTAVRFLPWVESLLDRDPPTAAKIIAWLAPELKPTTHYRAALCGDWPATPETIVAKAAVLKNQIAQDFDPQTLLPEWFREHCPAAFESPHLDSINTRAGVWVRLQCNHPEVVLDEFRGQRWEFEQSPDFPDALRLPPNAEVANTDAYRRGFVEIQDLGSQLVLAHATIKPGSRWLDACAGAGGKTLQLARALGSDGHVDATDIRLEILEELRDRATRARIENITLLKNPTTDYDGVLVDAPCSGSGTWRRQPHLKWYVQPATIAEFAKLQLQILATNAPRVRPGGVLVYATCSLSHHENQAVVAAFLKTHAEFSPEPPPRAYGGTYDGYGTTLLPGTLNTDGFYAAALRKRPA